MGFQPERNRLNARIYDIILIFCVCHLCNGNVTQIKMENNRNDD